MKLESCSICEPCGAIFFNYSRRSSSTGRATGGAPDLANKRAAFPSAPLGKCDCQDGGEGTATRDGDGRKKHAARLEERRLSCASLTSSYIRESLRPTIEPYPLPRRRYFATLRRLLETSRLSCGIAWIKEEERGGTQGWSNCLVWTICWGGEYVSEVRLNLLFYFIFFFHFWYIAQIDNGDRAI